MKIVEMQVDYVDHMGNDDAVADAARVSFLKSADKYTEEQNNKLIHYLAKNNHWSPFGHCVVKLRIKAPIFVARQLVKHQVGLVWNEVSRRYVDDAPEFWFPKEWRGRPVNAKQGSDGLVDLKEVDIYPENALTFCLNYYNTLLTAGVAPEQARMVLPQNTMTEWIWTGSLAAWARVVKLRTDEHAQVETRHVAYLIKDIIYDLFPVSMKALMEY